MSGHSKWSTIKHRKAAQDAKRGKIFTKLIKEITIAARLGGGDADANPRLRSAISAAKSQSMPKENIDRAIKKGTGELEGVSYEEIMYEGYGPHNVAIMVEVMTDNRNRSTASVRYAFNKMNGNLGATNSVQYMFDRYGIIHIPKDSIDEVSLLEILLEAGAEDLDTSNNDFYEVLCAPTDFPDVTSVLEDKEVKMNNAEIAWVPQTRVEIDDVQQAEQVMKLIDLLEDDDDVQKVHSNFDISEDVLAQMSEQ